MNRIEKLFAQALKAAGIPFEFWKASREKCIYCGGDAPDFSVKGKAFHYSCLPRQAELGQADSYLEWAEKSEKLWKERAALFEAKDEV